MTLGDFFTLCCIGLIAGWLAGLLMKGGGYGLLGSMLLGIVGAVLGGGLFAMLGLTAYGFLGRVVVACVGSVVLVGLARMLRGRPVEAKR
jgi:uncharacterized membrane protein YeaQ/YmgE (transglycosylase-associated protein family)